MSEQSLVEALEANKETITKDVRNAITMFNDAVTRFEGDKGRFCITTGVPVSESVRDIFRLYLWDQGFMMENERGSPIFDIEIVNMRIQPRDSCWAWYEIRKKIKDYPEIVLERTVKEIVEKVKGLRYPDQIELEYGLPVVVYQEKFEVLRDRLKLLHISMRLSDGPNRRVYVSLACTTDVLQKFMRENGVV